MRYVVGVIVGAVIGYLTNWLAIKMLFRPYKEKRILGVKVPFTPGLIPKEKDRIARNISESVGEHLLNKESISKALKEEAIKDKVKAGVENKLDTFILSKGTVKERIENLFGEKTNSIILVGETKIKEKMISTIKEKREQKIILNFILKEVNNNLNKKPVLLLNLLDNIKFDKLSNEIIRVIPKEEIYDIIEKNIKDKLGELEDNNKLIGDLIPKGVFDATNNYIINHREEICHEICNTLRSDAVSYRIKEKIESYLFSGLKGIVTMFLSVDLVYDKMVGALEAYLMEEDNQKIVCSYISNYINRMADVKVEAFIENMPADLNSNIAKLIGDKGLDILLDKGNLNRIKEFLVNYILNFESYDLLIKSINENYKEKLNEHVENIVNNIIDSKKMEDTINIIISYVKSEILNYNISNDIEKANLIKKFVEELIEKNYDDFVDKEIPQVLEIVDISKIVENQINSFEVDYAEQLIVNIANKELKAITWLGALLGGVLGILSPIIGSIKF